MLSFLLCKCHPGCHLWYKTNFWTVNIISHSQADCNCLVQTRWVELPVYDACISLPRWTATWKMNTLHEVSEVMDTQVWGKREWWWWSPTAFCKSLCSFMSWFVYKLLLLFYSNLWSISSVLQSRHESWAPDALVAQTCVCWCWF